MRRTYLALALALSGLAPAPAAVAQPQHKPAAEPPPDAAEPATPSPTAATPTPAPTAASDAGKPADVDSLRQEYLKLRDELFRSRARAAAVASALYSSKLRLTLHFDSGRSYAVTRAVVRLDGASVFDDSQGAIASDDAPRFDGFVAPGRHSVTIRIEATAKDDQGFSTATEETFVVQAPAGRDVLVKAKAEDDGDIGYAWQREQAGSYKLHLDVKIETQKRSEPRAGASRGSAARHAQR